MGIIGVLLPRVASYQVERLLSSVDVIDANNDGVVDAREVAMYYTADPPCVRPPLTIMGLRFGGGQAC